MALDPKRGWKVTAEVTGIKGKCSAGHNVGDIFNLSCTNVDGLCGFCFNAIFPNLQTFQFGGSMPWWQGDMIYQQCPDPVNVLTLKLSREKREH